MPEDDKKGTYIAPHFRKTYNQQLRDTNDEQKNYTAPYDNHEDKTNVQQSTNQRYKGPHERMTGQRFGDNDRYNNRYNNRSDNQSDNRYNTRDNHQGNTRDNNRDEKSDVQNQNHNQKKVDDVFVAIDKIKTQVNIASIEEFPELRPAKRVHLHLSSNNTSNSSPIGNASAFGAEIATYDDTSINKTHHKHSWYNGQNDKLSVNPSAKPSVKPNVKLNVNPNVSPNIKSNNTSNNMSNDRSYAATDSDSVSSSLHKIDNGIIDDDEILSAWLDDDAPTPAPALTNIIQTDNKQKTFADIAREIKTNKIKSESESKSKTEISSKQTTNNTISNTNGTDITDNKDNNGDNWDDMINEEFANTIKDVQSQPLNTFDVSILNNTNKNKNKNKKQPLLTSILKTPNNQNINLNIKFATYNKNVVNAKNDSWDEYDDNWEDEF
jgi:hypothetical protein